MFDLPDQAPLWAALPAFEFLVGILVLAGVRLRRARRDESRILSQTSMPKSGSVAGFLGGLLVALSVLATIVLASKEATAAFRTIPGVTLPWIVSTMVAGAATILAWTLVGYLPARARYAELRRDPAAVHDVQSLGVGHNNRVIYKPRFVIGDPVVVQIGDSEPRWLGPAQELGCTVGSGSVTLDLARSTGDKHDARPHRVVELTTMPGESTAVTISERDHSTVKVSAVDGWGSFSVLEDRCTSPWTGALTTPGRGECHD